MEPELAALMGGRPVRIDVHYSGGHGYWASVNGRDAGVYATTWEGLAEGLRDVVPGLVATSRKGATG